MNVLRYAVAGLLLFASWANHTRLFGIGGGDLVTLILAVVGALAVGVVAVVVAVQPIGLTFTSPGRSPS